MAEAPPQMRQSTVVILLKTQTAGPQIRSSDGLAQTAAKFQSVSNVNQQVAKIIKSGDRELKLHPS